MTVQENIIFKNLSNILHITQHRAENFTMQVAMRNHETNLINMAYDCSKERNGEQDMDDFFVEEELKLS